jgi:hypothetical protein
MEESSILDEGSNDPSITIAVATHKPYRMPVDSVYLPLHVGAALHPEVLVSMAGDNTGDNISAKNNYYSELTGLYWLWQNNHSAYKGLVHYRRLLGFADISKRIFQRDQYKKIANGGEFERLLKGCDIILAKRRNYYIETVYSHYSHTFESKHLDLCREVMKENASQYVAAWDRSMAARGAHMFNMFVMKRSKFNDYCEFVFSILEEMEKRLSPSQYDAFDARYLGRVSELLMDPWLETNGYSYKELPVISPEPINWFKKGGAFLMAKFGGRKYGKSF